MIFAREEGVVCLTIVNGRETVADNTLELCSTQEETYKQIILYVLHIAETAPDTIIVRSPDTDVFVVLLRNPLSLAKSVLFDTGVGDKRLLIDVKAAACDLGEGMCRHFLASIATPVVTPLVPPSGKAS